MVTRALLHLASNKRVERWVLANQWSHSVSSRFVAGECIEDTIPVVRGLNNRNLSVSLDFLGESITSPQGVAAVVDTYLRLFQTIRQEKLQANVSLKLTSLGIDLSVEECYRAMCRLLQAGGKDNFVRIDMEDSAHTQSTLDLFYRLWNGPERHRNVGVVIQSYLRRSEADIEKLIENGVRVRLCKGAYRESAAVAFPDKRDVDASYVRLMKRLLKHGHYPGIATHDPAMIEATLHFAHENQIASDQYEFQMLFGIRRDLQDKLAQDGHPVRVYTPFGAQWYPYFMRRLAERPANLWFVVKNMVHR